MAALSNYLENKFIDFLLRGQTFVPPANVYVGLLTAAPSDAGGGVEVSGGSYARAAIASNLNNWAGTQGSGTTTASSGSSGATSNNAVITYAAPTGYWGTITHVGVYDSAQGGNLLWHCQLAASKTIQAGDPAPSFPATTLTLQIDD